MGGLTPTDRVKVRLVVREVERYERVVEMPRALFELNRDRLTHASPDVVPEVACLLVDCFVDDHGDDFDEFTEIERFELADPAEAASLEVYDGGMDGGGTQALAAAAAVGAGLDGESLEQGDVL